MKKENNFFKKPHIERSSVVRMSTIMEEFVDGFDFLKKYNNTVTFFGSARTKPQNKYYKEAFDLAYKLAEEGYTIMTGGGGGIMEAANKGAYMAGGNSVGIGIKLPQEQRINKYAKDSMTFHYFFSRKVMLTFGSQAYIFLPGGFGTLDEFFEIITLIQTQKIKKIPVILIHKSYWEPVLNLIENNLYKRKKAICKKDMKIYSLVESIEEASILLKKRYRKK